MKQTIFIGFAVLFISKQVFAVSPVTEKYLKEQDFSELLKPKKTFLGFIAPNFQRLKIDFTKVAKSPTDRAVYKVEGTTQVKENVCKFAGEITVDEIKERTQKHFGADDSRQEQGLKAHGTFIGNYDFKEEKAKKSCGYLKGTMELSFYVDKVGTIRYDDIEDFSDSYKNNQYRGTWTSYATKKSKKANWGELRIPDSGDLDIGAAEFSANPKYKNNGWNDLVQ